MVAAHYDGPVPVEDRGGMGVKDHDKWAFPLCNHHHMIQHNLGWKKFDQLYGVDSREAAQAFARRSPHRKDWE